MMKMVVHDVFAIIHQIIQASFTIFTPKNFSENLLMYTVKQYYYSTAYNINTNYCIELLLKREGPTYAGLDASLTDVFTQQIAI